MTTTLLIRDEQLGGDSVREFELELPSERIDVRELIRSRVFQEVKDFNARQGLIEFDGLIQPTETERTLNGFRMKKRRRIDWQKQFARAVEAFETNQILILLDDRQLAERDETIEIKTGSKVTFLRLTLLVGG